MTITVLTINASLFGAHGASTQLNQKLLAALEREHGPLRVIERDLAQAPLPYFDAAMISALAAAETERNSHQQTRVELADQLIAELREANIVVVAAPMYNFGVPAQLKTWLDYLARAGVTFRYTANGPEGLLADRPVYITATRGGQHQGRASDSQSAFLRTFFNFLGLKDLRFVYAEGLSTGLKEQSLMAAEAAITEWVSDHAEIN